MKLGRLLVALSHSVVVCPAAEPMVTTLLSSAERSYQDGDFTQARRLFQQLVEFEPASPRGLLGLALAEQAAFLPGPAQEHLSRAFLLAPNDPTVVREYAAAAADARLETALLNRLVRISSTPAAWAEEAQSRLALLAGLAGKPIHQLQNPYVPYRMKLGIARSRDGSPLGWMLPVRINGSRPLRFLLDTGSRGLLLSRPASGRLNLDALAPARFGGFGDGGPDRGKFALASSVEVNGLEWRNVVVEVMDKPMFVELDGLVGVDLFRQFRITLDGRGKMLDLEPFAGQDPAEGAGHRPWRSGGASAPPAAEPTLHRVGHLLLASMRTEEGTRANYVIDSGASYSVVHQSEPLIAVRTVVLEGLSGVTRAPQLMRPLKMEIGGQPVVLSQAVASDLSPIGAAFGVRIDGFAGFPLLSQMVTTLDLRSGALAVAPGQRKRNLTVQASVR